MRRQHVVFVAAVALLPAVLAAGGPATKDYTHVDPRELGITPVPAKKDPKTGFVVGGKNATGLIGKLTEIAGRPVAALEVAMRPGQLTTAGFLAKGERLLEVLAADNRYVVDELGLTHQELARHLHVLGALALKHAQREPKEIRYHGRRYRVSARLFRNFAESPFEDGTKTNCEATVRNLDNGKSVHYALLVPDMIERYGFYEGKGTRYRVEPRAIVEVFDFLKARGR